jgi:hypothetical protein
LSEKYPNPNAASVFSGLSVRQLPSDVSALKGLATLNASLAGAEQIELTIVSSFLDMPSDVATAICRANKPRVRSLPFFTQNVDDRTIAVARNTRQQNDAFELAREFSRLACKKLRVEIDARTTR